MLIEEGDICLGWQLVIHDFIFKIYIKKNKISFCMAKEIINKTKRQPTEWEKIFANYMTIRG